MLKNYRTLVGSTLFLLAASGASAQEINLDANTMRGVPRTNFGGVPGQSGTWNTFPGVVPGNTSTKSLDSIYGENAAAFIELSQPSGSPFGIFGEITTPVQLTRVERPMMGDWMNPHASAFNPRRIVRLKDLLPGRYAVTVYSWSNGPGLVNGGTITIAPGPFGGPGSINSISSVGPYPGLIQNTTYVTASSDLGCTSQITIELDTFNKPNFNIACNGIQVVPVSIGTSIPNETAAGVSFPNSNGVIADLRAHGNVDGGCIWFTVRSLRAGPPSPSSPACRTRTPCSKAAPTEAYSWSLASRAAPLGRSS